MPRRSHVKVESGEASEKIKQFYIDLALSRPQHDYLLNKVAAFNERRRAEGITRRVSIQDIIRAMIDSHANKDRLLSRQMDPKDI